MRWLGKVSQSKRGVALMMTFCLAAIAGYGITRTTIGADYSIFFDDSNPQYQAYLELESTFTPTNNVLFVIKPKQGDVFQPYAIRAIRRLTDEAWQLPRVLRIESIVNFQNIVSLDDSVEIGDLIPKQERYSEADLVEARQTALSERLLVRRLISDDGYTTAISANFTIPDEERSRIIREILSASKALAQEFAAENPDLEIYVSGRVPNRAAFAQASIVDFTTIVPTALVVTFGVLLSLYIFLLRHFWLSVWSTVATFIVSVSAVIFAQGIVGWLEIIVSPIGANAPTMILTLALADCIHLTATAIKYRRLELAWIQALDVSIKENFEPITLTSLTTAFGFLSMNFSDSPPFRDLGNTVAIGVVVAWALTFVMLPRLLSLFGGRKLGNQEADRVGTTPRKYLFWIGSHAKWVVFSISILTVAIASGIGKIELNDVWGDYFDESFAIRRANDFTRENLTGINSIEYMLPAPDGAMISDPTYLKAVDDFAGWLESQPEVVTVNHLIFTMKRLNQALHGGDSGAYTLPDNAELAAQSLLIYEFSLPLGFDLTDQIDIDRRKTKLVAVVKQISTRQLLDLQTRADLWLIDHHPGMRYGGSGTDIMGAHMGERNVRAMIWGTTIGAAVISLSLIVAYRSLKLGAVVIIANFLPASVAFGAWGYFVGMVGVSSSVVVGMTMGIVVDFAIHLFARYRRYIKHKEPLEAVAYATNDVLHPILFTTIILCTNFGILSLSPFALNSDMGSLTTMTVAIAGISSLIFLPALLVVLSWYGGEDDRA